MDVVDEITLIMVRPGKEDDGAAAWKTASWPATTAGNSVANGDGK